MGASRGAVPFLKRPADVAIVVFFVIAFFIVFLLDLEQVAISDPSIPFDYPLMPPKFFVDLIHWWGRTYDHVLWVRETWFKATIYIDLFYFAPFYLVAIPAFILGKDWIRMPTMFWSGVMFTIVTCILAEEVWGAHASPDIAVILAAYGPYWLAPLLIALRMFVGGSHPFSRKAAAAPAAAAKPKKH
eukprot:EC724042.1.p1 GENE.EC724042.1~~EC724042.1.p1  ORF type:complete len:187 (+),score=43.90 EC724042.1:61-621(+)